MKTKRILITLSLGYGINMMGFESSLTREQISVSNPELTVLSLREFLYAVQGEPAPHG